MPNNNAQSLDQNQRNTQIAIGIAVIVVVGLLAWWLFSKPAGSAGSMATSTNSIASTTSSTSVGSDVAMAAGDVSNASSGETVTVKDQPAGDSVRIASVTLTKAGWVAVRDTNRVYGAAWLPAGTHENVSVGLLRNTVSGTKYTVALYVDNGNKKFELHTDALISGVGTTFTATHGD